MLMFGWNFDIDTWSRYKKVTLKSRTQPSGPLCLWQCFGHSEQLENFTEIYWAHKTCKPPQAWASTVITKRVIQNLDIFFILFPSFESFYHLSTALIAFTSSWQLRQLIKDLNYLNSFCQGSVFSSYLNLLTQLINLLRQYFVVLRSLASKKR